MKTKFLLFSFISLLLLFSCNNDDGTNTTISNEDVLQSTAADDVSDDITDIVDLQSNETEFTGKNGQGNGHLFSDCAAITTVKKENTITRTIDFGDTNCTLYNGSKVRGKIIITFNTNFDAKTRTLSYSLENFYHNDRHIEGDRTVVKTILENGHPQATINLNLTIANVDGSIITREGNRIREFVSGFETPFNMMDNVFSTTGNWTTTFNNNIVIEATITSPLIVKMDCPHIVSGAITITKNGNMAILDYGNGECDNTATVTKNGETKTIVLGKK